jgi:hypothetical protein
MLVEGRGVVVVAGDYEDEKFIQSVMTGVNRRGEA